MLQSTYNGGLLWKLRVQCGLPSDTMSTSTASEEFSKNGRLIAIPSELAILTGVLR